MFKSDSTNITTGAQSLPSWTYFIKSEKTLSSNGLNLIVVVREKTSLAWPHILHTDTYQLEIICAALYSAALIVCN